MMRLFLNASIRVTSAEFHEAKSYLLEHLSRSSEIVNSSIAINFSSAPSACELRGTSKPIDYPAPMRVVINFAYALDAAVFFRDLDAQSSGGEKERGKERVRRA
jgi:hypothetical protein